MIKIFKKIFKNLKIKLINKLNNKNQMKILSMRKYNILHLKFNNLKKKIYQLKIKI